jgi:hypothetical protein
MFLPEVNKRYNIAAYIYISNRKIFGRYRELYLQIRFTTKI